MSRPRKPEALKLVSGTSRPSRLPPPDSAAVTLPPITELPEPPRWLPNQHAVDEWRRLGPILVRHKLLTEANVHGFALLCGSHGQIVEMWANGMHVPAAVMSAHRTILGEFGLTPSTSSKAKVNGEAPKGNPFATNGRPANAA